MLQAEFSADAQALPEEAVRLRPDFPSDDKRALAAELFERGLGYRRVAAALGLSVYTVRDWSRQHASGTFAPKLKQQTYRYTEDFKSKVVALREAGMSWSELKRTTGVASATCRKWMNKKGKR